MGLHQNTVMQRKLTFQERNIIKAIKALGGTPTTKEIAHRCGYEMNSVTETLMRLHHLVQQTGGTAGDSTWELLT
jgi:hypothetical protein